jgi:Fe-S cluster assembly protein SufD
MEVTTIQTPALGISRDAVERLSERRNEPEWLRRRRQEAWETFERTPVPLMTDEEWRRTDIRKLDFGSFNVPAEAGRAYEPDDTSDHRSGFVQLADGFITELQLDRALAEQGVILCSLSDAASQHPEIVQKYLGRLAPDEYGKFASLANALSSGGFMYVPANVQVELPVQASHTLSEGGSAVFPRTLLVAERYSSVTFIDRYYSSNQEVASLSVGAVEVFAGEGSQVRYVNVQEWGRNVWNFLIEKHHVERDAQENNLNIALGGKFSKGNVEAALVGPNANCELLGLNFGDETQFFDFHTLQDHAAPHCFSDLLYKGVLRDRSRSVFSGLIHVRPGSAKTDAYQTNRNLLLSDTARADSIPNLEIENNDVKCSHGASVGPIDRDQLFYLMARGLSKRDAERLIVDGFFEPLISRIPLEGVRERLQAAIDQKMD